MLSCNLSDSELADRFDILARTGGTLFDGLDDTEDDEDADGTDDEGASGGRGNKVKLKPWSQARARRLGWTRRVAAPCR